jgi:hypothetical protein
MKFARIVNNSAVDVRTESPDGCFTPDIVSEFITVPDEVENGWNLENNIWVAPPPPPIPVIPPAPEPAPQDPKLVGTLINGVMCSATRDDQNGLTAVAMGITLARASGKTFPDTVFQFSNGNTMVITDANFDAAYSKWVPFRQSFFSAN